jgi:hypothetical protein
LYSMGTAPRSARSRFDGAARGLLVDTQM